MSSPWHHHARAGRLALALALVTIMIVPSLCSVVAETAPVLGSASSRDAVSLDPLTNPHMYHAEAAARWLISQAVEPAPGVYKWHASDVDLSYNLELPLGASGIGGFLIEIYVATDNASYLKYAEGAARYIISRAETTAPDASKWSSTESYSSYAPDKFAGAGAVGEFLLRLWEVTGNGTYLNYSKRAANWLIDTAVAQYGGYKWETFPGYDFNFTGWAHGVAGISDFMRMLGTATDNATYMDYAEGGARWLIATAMTPSPGEYTWRRIETNDYPMNTWCGGTPGIVLFLILLYDTTGNSTYLEYAKGGGKWMAGNASDLGNGIITFSGFSNMFCHGDPSSSYVMFMLYNRTADPFYLRYAEGSANWTISTGIEVGKEEMKWPAMTGTDYYETGLLMGASGIGHQMLYAYNVTGKDRYLDYGLRAARWVENMSVEVSAGVEKWNWEEKKRADEEYCTGWYHGAAGIGLFLIEAAEHWTPPVVRGLDILGGDVNASARPGDVHPFNVTIKNTGNAVDDVNVLVGQIPQGWTVVTNFSGSSVSSGENRTLRLDVGVPIWALAGAQMTFPVTARSFGDRNITDSINITTIADEVHGIDVLNASVSGNAGPGETVNQSIIIKNTGNAPDTITLEPPKVKDGWAFEYVLDGEDIPAGGSRTAVLKTTSPVAAPAGASWVRVIKAVSAEDADASDTVELTTIVDDRPGIDILGPDLTGQASPGLGISYDLKVMNTGNSPLTPVISIDSDPEGWTVETRNGSLKELRPTETMDFSVMVIPPVPTMAGIEGIAVVKASSGDGKTGPQDTIRLTTSVANLPGLLVEAGPAVTSPPNKRVDLTFVLTNTGNFQDSYSIELLSKKGWTLTLDGNDSITLGPSSKAEVNGTLEVPAMSPAGTMDTVSLRLVSAYSSDVQGGAAINVTVEPVRALEVKVKKAPDEVVAGGRVEYGFEVINLGNEDLTLTVEVVGVNASWVTLPIPVLRVAIGGTVTANMTIEPEGSAFGEFGFVVHFANRDVDASASINLTVLAPEGPVPGGEAMDGDGTDIRTEGVPLWGLLAMVGLVIAVVAMVGLIAWTRSRKKGGQ